MLTIPSVLAGHNCACTEGGSRYTQNALKLTSGCCSEMVNGCSISILGGVTLRTQDGAAHVSLSPSRTREQILSVAIVYY